MSNILSQFQLSESNLMSISFEVLPGVPTVTSGFSMEISRSFNDEWSEDDSGVRCECILAVKCTWRNSDADVDVCVASCMVRGAVVSDGVDRDDEFERYLHANAISFLYGRARTFIEFVSFSSQVGVMELPAIVPLELLDESEDMS